MGLIKNSVFDVIDVNYIGVLKGESDIEKNNRSSK
jgi:hypothetical protein